MAHSFRAFSPQLAGPVALVSGGKYIIVELWGAEEVCSRPSCGEMKKKSKGLSSQVPTKDWTSRT